MQLPAKPLPADSFDDLYRSFRDRVYRFCLLQVGDPAVAEDIAAETWVAAFRSYDSARPEPERVHLWLFRIAKNLTTDHWRRTSRWNRLLGLIGHTQQAADVESIAVLREDGRRVLRAMKRLSARDQRLISLRLGAGLSFHEVGELMGMSERTAVVATGRALERLRKHDREAQTS